MGFTDCPAQLMFLTFISGTTLYSKEFTVKTSLFMLPSDLLRVVLTVSIPVTNYLTLNFQNSYFPFWGFLWSLSDLDRQSVLFKTYQCPTIIPYSVIEQKCKSVLFHNRHYTALIRMELLRNCITQRSVQKRVSIDLHLKQRSV